MPVRLEDILRLSMTEMNDTRLTGLECQIQGLFGGPDWSITDVEVIDGVGIRLVVLFRSMFLRDHLRSVQEVAEDRVLLPCDVFGVVPLVCTVLCRDHLTHGVTIERGYATLFLSGRDYRDLAARLRAFFHHWSCLRDMLVSMLQRQPASVWQKIDSWREFLAGESGLSTMPLSANVSNDQRQRAMRQLVMACNAFLYSILGPSSFDEGIVRLLMDWLAGLIPRADMADIQNTTTEVMCNAVR